MIIVKPSSSVVVFRSVKVNAYKGNVYIRRFREMGQNLDSEAKYGHYKIARTKALDD